MGTVTARRGSGISLHVSAVSRRTGGFGRPYSVNPAMLLLYRKAGLVLLRVAQVVLVHFLAVTGVFAADETIGWSHYGNDAGGLRYSAAALISAGNVTGVRQQWIFRTGDLARRSPEVMRRIKFQTTPILAADKLVFLSLIHI